MVAANSALVTVALSGGKLPSWFVVLLLVAVALAFVSSIGSFFSIFISKFYESDKNDKSDGNDNVSKG